MALTYDVFKTTAKAFVRYDQGINYLSDNSLDEDVFFNDRLKAFTAETLCLYETGAALTLTDAQAAYNYRTASFSPSTVFVDVDHITIRDTNSIDSILMNFNGHPGPISWDELLGAYPNFVNALEGRPLYWAKTAPHSVYLYPKPDTATYPTAYFSGPKFHATLSGTDALTIPEEYQRVAAIYAAASLMAPYATGDTYALMRQIDETAFKAMMDLKAAGRSRRKATGNRGRGITMVSLG